MHFRLAPSSIGRRSVAALASAAILAALALLANSLVQSAAASAETGSGGICDRTQQVQDAILNKLSDVSECGTVTDTHLSGITGEIIILDNTELTLKDEDFEGLSNLRVLYIHHNGLSALPEEVFDGLSGLTELYLYNNALTALPEDVFDGLSNLETLSLSYNSLSALPGDVFDGLSSLTTLQLDNNSIGDIPDGVFEDLSELEKLNLNANSLEGVADTDFNGLTSLKDLRLASNNLEELPFDVFHEMTNLQTLHLYSAGISDLPAGLFYGLSDLQNVHLHTNPGAPFTLDPQLEGPDLGKVMVKVVEGAPFDLSVTLSAEGGTLSTSTVSIAGGAQASDLVAVSPTRADGDVTVKVASATFQTGTYDGIQAGAGETLTVTFPGICGRTQEVQDAILAKLSGVSDCADVTDTHLSTVWGYMGFERLGLTALKSGDFAGLSSLNNLNLSNNSIDTLPGDIFDGLTSLNTLLLIYTGLDTLSEDVFEDLSSLKYLRLNGNDLTVLPKEIFDGLNLIELPLQYNDFSTLPGDVFDGLDDLTLLGLDNNQLTVIPDGLFEGLTSLNRLELQSNTGSPFKFKADLVNKGNNSVAVKVAAGAPYDMQVTLSVEGGALSTTTVTISGGSTESSAIVVTPSGNEDVTVTVDSAKFLEGYGPSAIPELADRLLSSGIQAGVGDDLVVQINSPATGAPTITGTAQVGQTLTADTSGISDADGLTNVTYSYQWLSSRYTEVEGATSSTYTLQASEEGKVVKVRVTFIDDAGNDESLTSDGTSAVVVGGL